MTNETTPNLDKVRGLDFDRLDDLVSERLAVLKLYAQNIDKTSNTDPAINVDGAYPDGIVPRPGRYPGGPRNKV